MLSTRVRTRSSFQPANDTIRSFASDTVGKLVAVVCFVFAIGDAKGGEMTPWGGASAEASAWQDKISSAQGLNSSVSLYGNRSFGYRDHSGNPYTGNWGVRSSAQVFDSKSKMIGVNDSTGSSLGGYSDSVTWYQQVPTEAYAQASWTNDSIHIQPLAGQALPDHIKVVFQADMVLPLDNLARNSMAGLYGSIDLRINNKSATFDGYDYYLDGPYSKVGPFFDGGVTTTDTNYPGTQNVTGLVSLDLAVNASGWTDPFSLSIKSTPGASLYGRDHPDLAKGITVGLKDLTTLDGLSLESQGYKITYASDLTVPSPVPEPASWVVMATVFTAILFYRNTGVTRRAYV